MAARTNLTARMDALETALSTLVDALTAAQAKAAPAQAPKAPKAKSAFFEEVIVARATNRVPCGVAEHGKACNRTFSANSSGVSNHLARLI